MRFRRLEWTDQLDAAISRMRHAEQTWEGIAAAIGVSRWKIIERAKIIGVWTPPLPRKADPETFAPPDEREPFEPGHPETWGAITRGTLLEGAPYAYTPPNTRPEQAEWKMEEAA